MTRSGYLVRAATVGVSAALFAFAPFADASPVAAARAASAPVAAVKTAATVEPNDPFWRQSWSQSFLRMPEVWARTTGSPQVVIATVDSGVDPSVVDLQGALVPGWDFIAHDAVPRDTVYHGTQVASVIAARGDNGIGIAGYCWTCKIMPVRVTADGKATGAEIAQGIYWAVDHGARIITIGLNSGSESDDESVAALYARDRGVLVIASAGNTGTDALRYPASYDGVLPVAAVNDSDMLYAWSTRGSWIHLAAPGCQLVLDPGVGPGTQCGTSYTPAVVAGIVGLMLALKPSLTNAEILAALTSTAVPVQGIDGGRINPLAALAAVAPPPVTPVPSTPPPVTRDLEFSNGIMRTRLTRYVSVGAGRLEVQLQAAGAGECQISLRSSSGDVIVPLLRSGEANLVSLSQVVKAGRQRVSIDCDPGRRRSYTLSISHAIPAKRAVSLKG